MCFRCHSNFSYELIEKNVSCKSSFQHFKKLSSETQRHQDRTIQFYSAISSLSYPAFNFLDFLPGSYQDSSGFLDIPTRNPTRILQDHGRLSRKSRKPTRKFRNSGVLPGNPGIIFPILSEFPRRSPSFPVFFRIFQDPSGSLRIAFQSPEFVISPNCRDFQDTVPVFPSFFRVSQDCFLKS